MKYDNVIFFNYFHLGDLHISRNYIKKIMSRIPANNYFETNQYGEDVLKDIDNLQYLRWHSFTDFCGVRYDVPFAVSMNGDLRTLFVNTWVGQNQPLNKMPRDNGVCTFRRNNENYNLILKELGFDEIRDDDVDVFPSVDYEKYEIENVDSFLRKTFGPFVLLFNNEVKSGQCENFDFDPIAEKLCKEFPEHKFILSNDTELTKDKSINNIFSASDIIKKDSMDLNELSYLSTFCDVLIGRNSGPQTFAYVIENFLCPNKKNITICDHKNESDYMANTYEECKMRTYWMKYGEKDVFEFIKESINETK